MGEEGKEIETIFDHGVTDEELKELFLGEALGLYHMTKERYFEEELDSPGVNYVHLCTLYRIRRNKKMMMKYNKKIPWPEAKKLVFIMAHCEEYDADWFND